MYKREPELRLVPLLSALPVPVPSLGLGHSGPVRWFGLWPRPMCLCIRHSSRFICVAHLPVFRAFLHHRFCCRLPITSPLMLTEMFKLMTAPSIRPNLSQCPPPTELYVPGVLRQRRGGLANSVFGIYKYAEVRYPNGFGIISLAASQCDHCWPEYRRGFTETCPRRRRRSLMAGLI